MIKKLGKATLCKLLARQVVQLRKQHKFTVVAVAGSVGKTSTKLAIAHTLQQRQRVIFQEGNYNDLLTVPLVLFGHEEPPIFNILAWLKILAANRRIIKRGYPYDIAVLELGTDAPGQLAGFAYLKPELTVITAVAPEHMVYFKTLDAVAKEELIPLGYSERVLLNVDDIPEKYLPDTPFLGYGTGNGAQYLLADREQSLEGQKLELMLASSQKLAANIPGVGEPAAKSALAAAAVASLLKWTNDDIAKALGKLTPVAGRMQLLPGIHGSTIIDDTYNASPVAVKAALDTLCSFPAEQRVAVLGSMNELGSTEQHEHQAIGAYCNPQKLDLVVTIGDVARNYLAPAAEAVGCTVISFTSPYEAGRYLAENLKSKSLVLAKGSQNGVFAEEALKPILKDPNDALKLVRQSPYWLGVKKQQFPNG